MSANPRIPVRGLVSVIIPVYNRPEMLAEATESVFAQTYLQIEIVIVDDGSSDSTWASAQTLAAARPDVVRAVRQDNAGPGAARNLGLAWARGEFIQFLDSDDLLEPMKFELQVQALRENLNAGVAYGLTRRVNLITGASLPWAQTGELITNLFPSFLMKRGWDTNSPLWRREVCDQIGPWSCYRCMEDWEHDLRAGLIGVTPVRVVEHVATVRDHLNARASGMYSGFTPAFALDFFRAHREIWQLMRVRGLTDWSYLREFSRKLFWIARLCGGLGLSQEADEALAIAGEMAATHHTPWEIRIYSVLTRLLGWPIAVECSERVWRGLRLQRSGASGNAG